MKVVHYEGVYVMSVLWDPCTSGALAPCLCTVPFGLRYMVLLWAFPNSIDTVQPEIDFIWLAIASHKDCHCKFQNWSGVESEWRFPFCLNDHKALRLPFTFEPRMVYILSILSVSS